LLVAKICQGLHRTGCHKFNSASLAAITAVGNPSRLKPESFKTYAAGATIAGFYRYFRFIGKLPTGQFIISYSCG
jgi:hypothetical protein